MLTGFQVSTAAYMTEDGGLLCPDCFDRGDVFARPVIQYALDEEQSAYAQDYEWDDEDVDHSECEPALHDTNGHELLPEYHYGHDVDDDEIQNPPVPRWVPCSKCGAGDGEPHRDGCPEIAPRGVAR